MKNRHPNIIQFRQNMILFYHHPELTFPPPPQYTPDGIRRIHPLGSRAMSVSELSGSGDIHKKTFPEESSVTMTIPSETNISSQGCHP